MKKELKELKEEIKKLRKEIKELRNIPRYIPYVPYYQEPHYIKPYNPYPGTGNPDKWWYPPVITCEDKPRNYDDVTFTTSTTITNNTDMVWYDMKTGTFIDRS